MTRIAPPTGRTTIAEGPRKRPVLVFGKGGDRSGLGTGRFGGCLYLGVVRAGGAMACYVHFCPGCGFCRKNGRGAPFDGLRAGGSVRAGGVGAVGRAGVPACAGTTGGWIPACAGMTGGGAGWRGRASLDSPLRWWGGGGVGAVGRAGVPACAGTTGGWIPACAGMAGGGAGWRGRASLDSPLRWWGGGGAGLLLRRAEVAELLPEEEVVDDLDEAAKDERGAGEGGGHQDAGDVGRGHLAALPSEG